MDIASHYGWYLEGACDLLYYAVGEFIALTLRGAMLGMFDLAWISLPAYSLQRQVLRTAEPVVTNDVRLFLNIDPTACDFLRSGV